jgi:hypothetical protein
VPSSSGAPLKAELINEGATWTAVTVNAYLGVEEFRDIGNF